MIKKCRHQRERVAQPGAEDMAVLTLASKRYLGRTAVSLASGSAKKGFLPLGLPGTGSRRHSRRGPAGQPSRRGCTPRHAWRERRCDHLTQGDLGVEVESLKDDLAETMRSLEAEEALAAQLVESRGNQVSKCKEGERSSRVKVLAILKTIKFLSGDDALVLWKVNLPSPSSMQVHQGTAAGGRRARCELGRSLRTLSNSASNLKLTSLEFSGKSVDFSIIDEIVTLAEGEQGENDEKVYCMKSFDQTEDEDQEVIPSMPQERIQECIVEGIPDVHVPRVTGNRSKL